MLFLLCRKGLEVGVKKMNSTTQSEFSSKRIVIVDIDRKRGRMSANVSQHSKRRTSKRQQVMVGRREEAETKREGDETLFKASPGQTLRSWLGRWWCRDSHLSTPWRHVYLAIAGVARDRHRGDPLELPSPTSPPVKDGDAIPTIWM